MQLITSPPTYTPLSIEGNRQHQGDLPPHFSTIEPQKLPTYTQARKHSGWSIVIKSRFIIDGYRVFVSQDAANKYDAFKRSKHNDAVKLQQQGYGIPLFKVDTPFISFNKKFLTFRKYIPTCDNPFNEKCDFYDYCLVTKTSHSGYDTYNFEFTPDSNKPWLNFRVVMFSHTFLPIHDYIFRGRKHRWIDESTLLSQKENQLNMISVFKHTILSPNQVSLTDNWDGICDLLNREIENPYLVDNVESYSSLSFGSTNYRYQRSPKPEYYGRNFSNSQSMSDPVIKTTSNEINIGDISNRNDKINYESIFSLDEEDLVMICIAATLKRQKDILKKIEMEANATKNCR